MARLQTDDTAEDDQAEDKDCETNDSDAGPTSWASGIEERVWVPASERPTE